MAGASATSPGRRIWSACWSRSSGRCRTCTRPSRTSSPKTTWFSSGSSSPPPSREACWGCRPTASRSGGTRTTSTGSPTARSARSGPPTTSRRSWPRSVPSTRRGLPDISSRVDLRADAEVEADRFEDDERGAGGVDVGGGEDAGVLLDDRRGRVVDLCVLVGLDPGPGVVAVFGEERGRIDRDQGLLDAVDEVVHVLLVDDYVAAVAEPAHVAADEVLPREGHGFGWR